MIEKTKSLTKKLRIIPYRRDWQITPESVAAARAYIKKYWPKLTRYHPRDDDTLLGLPKPYLVPAFEQGHEFDFNELYYWDSYFMVQGILDTEHKELVLGILDDLLSMFERFGIIPNASRTYLMGRSQPPLLTSFILDIHRAYKLDKRQLDRAVKIAKKEYETVWMGETKPNARRVYKGLSRYYDINYVNDLAEAESGWDMTPRFGHHCLDYLPVCLNSLLYKYETDFAELAVHLGEKAEGRKWKRAAEKRQETMNELMWSEMKGSFYDYNFIKKSRSGTNSLAAFYPMWAGLATQRQAQRLVGNLRRFEQRGGLSTTDAMTFGRLVPGAQPMQWAYPNGWAPLHFLVVKGLQRYGYDNDARRIALKWLNTNLTWFNKHGVFLEKYNVVQPDKPPAKGLYPSQTGFGWTNSVFEAFCQEFIDR